MNSSSSRRTKESSKSGMSDVSVYGTDSLLENDSALVIFAQKLTGESWSQGMDDRVSRRSIRAQIDENADILDVDAFRIRLETLQTGGTLNEEGQKTVDEFLEAWRRRREGLDDL